jgi:hypothetical protein
MALRKGCIMKLRPFLCFCGFVLALLVPNLATAADSEHACPVTTPPNPAFVPPAPYRPNAYHGGFWYGSNALWTQLPVDGVWSGLPRRDNKGYFNKLFLWQQGFDGRKEPEADITVVLKRLDTHMPHVSSRGGTNAFFDNSWAMLTGVIFPTEGCWEVTSYYRGQALTFVLSIQR